MPPAVMNPHPVRVAVAESKPIRAWVFAEGAARSVRREYLTFNQSGRVETIADGPGGEPLRAGDPVKAGDLLTEPDTRTFAAGQSRQQAAALGGADRLRPILGTSITTTIGLIPLALSDPMWEPLCYAIIFGLAAGTVMSLLVTPPLYLLLTRREPGSASMPYDEPHLPDR